MGDILVIQPHLLYRQTNTCLKPSIIFLSLILFPIRKLYVHCRWAVSTSFHLSLRHPIPDQKKCVSIFRLLFQSQKIQLCVMVRLWEYDVCLSLFCSFNISFVCLFLFLFCFGGCWNTINVQKFSLFLLLYYIVWYTSMLRTHRVHYITYTREVHGIHGLLRCVVYP